MRFRSELKFVVVASVLATLQGCPKPGALPPPPKGGGGPVQTQLAKRDEALSSMRASAVIRMRIPEGMEGAPGGKVHAVVLAAARPERARIEVLTPLGTPGATILIADGLLQVFQPFSNELLKASLDSPDLAARSPFPIPMKSLPSLLRGSVPLLVGDVTETKVLATGSSGAATAIEVRAKDVLVQRVTVSNDGGYPTEDVHFENGAAVLTVQYLDYGAVKTEAGDVAVPQRVTASIVRPEGTATLDVALSDPEIAPKLGGDAFTLTFDPARPPRVQEIR